MAKALLFSCFSPISARRRHRLLAKLVFWGGATRFLAAQERHLAGELVLQFPDCVLCHADSFYIGLPPPVLSADDELLPGQTYFVLPADRVRRGQTLTTSSLAATLSPTPGRVALAGGGECPFAYVKTDDGRRLIKVLPEFIARVISTGEDGGKRIDDECGSLCSTPELKKHYALLVRPRDRPWSPALETIAERKKRATYKVSMLGMERR